MARRASRRRQAGERFDEQRGVFMISVAAELAGMHPQTLRMYEARGLIKPSRSPKQPSGWSDTARSGKETSGAWTLCSKKRWSVFSVDTSVRAFWNGIASLLSAMPRTVS